MFSIPFLSTTIVLCTQTQSFHNVNWCVCVSVYSLRLRKSVSGFELSVKFTYTNYIFLPLFIFNFIRYCLHGCPYTAHKLDCYICCVERITSFFPQHTQLLTGWKCFLCFSCLFLCARLVLRMWKTFHREISSLIDRFIFLI